MSARIRVVSDCRPSALRFVWWCTKDGMPRDGICDGGESATLAEAADAGREHLAKVHGSQMHVIPAPFVGQLTVTNRCACADLPRPSYPYFTPCPVHSYLVNNTTAPTLDAYCRTHGCRRDECGCGLTAPHSTPEASEYPNGVKVAHGGAGNARTGDYSPLHQTHNGSRADA